MELFLLLFAFFLILGLCIAAAVGVVWALVGALISLCDWLKKGRTK